MRWFRKPPVTIPEEVIIESPYITTKRLNMLKPVLQKLIDKGIQVYIITRDPQEHDEVMAEQSEAGITFFEMLGVQVLLCKGGQHRKSARIVPEHNDAG
ncbi:hypothetical protein BH11PAT1_BH11PAT1_3990 [soil metagenome]